MCFFHYPAPKPAPRHKGGRREKSTVTTRRRRTASIEDIEEAARRAAEEALDQAFPMAPYESSVNEMHHYYHYPCRGYNARGGCEDRRSRESPPSYNHITQSQLASHGEALRDALEAARGNGRKIDEVKASVQEAAREVREARDAIAKNQSDQAGGRDACAAEIGRVRRLMEEEAARREEARQSQRNMQEAWNYVQWFRQAGAEPKTSSTSSTSSSSRSGKSRRSRSSVEEEIREEKRRWKLEQQQHDEDVKRSVLGYMNEFLTEARPRGGITGKANTDTKNGSGGATSEEQQHPRGEHHNHFHAYAYAPAPHDHPAHQAPPPPQWAPGANCADPRRVGGWQQHQQGHPLFVDQNDPYNANMVFCGGEWVAGAGVGGGQGLPRYLCRHDVVGGGGWGPGGYAPRFM
ncbi:hypothetical protein GGS23DRAFT_278929 [Durotheca rogersii]|uniref:uncharacterized protein n=1 Tax=Durotheca rogersii TaxID=419775 RepID=UPI0022203B20|nr:uncharacterized protein GGS23DRAFT_278929 [Durotheca rogersii]KAI5866604.1 hypothetical protein GGS23DRAFT_278929 [Durotheca rogersii]